LSSLRIRKSSKPSKSACVHKRTIETIEPYISLDNHGYIIWKWHHGDWTQNTASMSKYRLCPYRWASDYRGKGSIGYSLLSVWTAAGILKKKDFPRWHEDGPKVFDTLEPSAVYRLAESKYIEQTALSNIDLGRTSPFSLGIGEYIFCQQDMDCTEGEWRLKSLLEEAIREVWWQRVECEGSWFLRLVPEDDRVAVQALRRMKAKSSLSLFQHGIDTPHSRTRRLFFNDLDFSYLTGMRNMRTSAYFFRKSPMV